ncbi:DUF2802 domain-containing protein [Pseudomonas schmalbachii]|uniref:DUF2802 domain-containing protein n=1 Tax=Pseudomonas schmalbachii TaxID=2816993 RepID=A0ABS3TT54_9PSED|nr:DUF2802 domain-containing protein [Pseudomonas schmalbachii]MBO3275744.1 DUF2802 domain-containing protein [Pseudomonas schmalbachii]
MLIALVVLGCACVALAVVFAFLLRDQRRQSVLLAQQAAHVAELDQRAKELGKRLEAYQQVNVRLGEQLRELGSQVAPLPERLNRIEQRDPASLSFNQAARLVGLGASATELSQSCGLSRAEAELMARLHGNRQQTG